MVNMFNIEEKFTQTGIIHCSLSQAEGIKKIAFPREF
jgi:hypothetical protein